MSRTARTTTRLEAVPDGDKPVWVQIACEGNFKGYQGGALEFTFDQKLFSKVIANFRKAKAYKLGSNGVGVADVIAWDFHHASEMPAASVGEKGAPAQGWIRELDLRIGPAGVAQLWALTRWLEPARSYVRAGQYRWASVSIVLDAIDPVSGKAIGPVLTSVALTNQPFIEGMQPLAASRNALAHTKGTNMKEAILSKARELLAAGETVNAMALSKAAAELCPNLSHHERWIKWVLPLNAENNLAAIAHAARNGAQLVKAKTLPTSTQATRSSASDSRPVLDVSAQHGPNQLAKVIAHVRGQAPGKSFDEYHQLACELNRTHRVIA